MTVLEYSFKQVAVRVGGKAALFADGVADLENAGDGTFYVRNLVLDTADGTLLLRWAARDNQTFEAHVFRAIESELYASRHANEAWAEQCEQERADAA